MATDPESPDPSGRSALSTELDTDRPGAGRVSTAAIERGQTLGRYVVLEKLGAGGMGVVYGAYDPELDRRVALKLMHERLSATQGSSGPPADPGSRSRNRLLAEAQAMARLTHPNVIAVHDVGTIDDQVFIAMEHVDGETLSAWMNRPERSWEEVLAVFVLAARGLEAAHRAGLIHRDFKPDNVLVSTAGHVRVLDFGLARLAGSEPEPSELDAETEGWRQSSLSSQTEARRVGTPAYMSPEQHLGQACDARSDQFSFCVACYEGLYGQRPFKGRTAMELAVSIADRDLAALPRDTKVPGRVRRALLRGLEADPALRYPDMGALIAALSRDPTRALRRAVAFGAVGAVALGIGLFATNDGPGPCTGAAEKMGEVWNSTRRAGLRAAFETTRLPYASSALSGVEEVLDAYAQQWEQMHTDTCLASAVRHEQSDDLLDRRMLCLDQRLAELDQLVGVFEEADRTTVERAVDASRGLSGLAHCADIEALMAGEEPPPPGAERERLESVDRGIARVRALEAAGRYQEAEEAAEVALAMAREAGSPSREARASMEMAGHYLHLNDGRTAEPLLYRAVELADRARDDHLRARALSSLVDALGRQDQFARARVFSGLARAALERIGSPPTGVASLDRALGVVALEQGRLTEARDHLERALEGVVKEHDETSSAYLNTLNNLAVVQRDLGEYAVALENFEAIRDSWRASYGEDHPGSAIMRMNVGTVLSTLGRQEQAIAEYGKALATFEKAIGPDCLDVGYTSEALAIAVGELGRYEEALGLHDRAQTIFRAHGEAGRTDLALSLDNMGVVYQLRGELERAREIHEESYRLWREAVGDDHPDLGYPLSHLAQDLWAMGDAAGARTKFDRALELFERASVAPDEVAEVRFNLAKTWEGEDDAMARRLAQQARAEYGRAGEGFRERAAEVDDWLSQLGPKTGD